MGLAEDYDTVLRSGRGHRMLGEHDAAIADFSRAHEMRPDQARPLVERGAILILQGRWDESLADYQAAQARQPGYPGLASYFAELYLYTGRAAEALTLSRQALGQEPDNLMHRINIGHALLLTGEGEAALATYREVAGQFHPVKRRSGAELIRDDLRLMAAADIPGADLVRAALNSGPA